MRSDEENLAFWLLKKVNPAIRKHGMIRDGDRVAVAVSGGKDSLALLRLLDRRRRSTPGNYELAAIHVLGDARGPHARVHPPLDAWLAAEGCERVGAPLMLDEGEGAPLSCQRCSFLRRKTLFKAAADLGCNVIALGHHADDDAGTALLNLLFHGRTEAMAPVRDYFEGKFRVIRPLIRVPEKEIVRFARACGFPPTPPVCPVGGATHRALVQELLRTIPGRNIRQVRANLVRVGQRGR